MKCPVCGKDLWLAGDSMMGGNYWTHISAQSKNFDEEYEADKHIPDELQMVGYKEK